MIHLKKLIMFRTHEKSYNCFEAISALCFSNGGLYEIDTMV